jgi:prepilin-type N-terminal cleavage/methylation domain-containing protein
MTQARNNTLGSSARLQRRAQGGFSLVELLCVLAIMSLLASASWPALSSMITGSQLTNNAYQLGDIMQQARTTAITQHTYVWLGFYSPASSGPASVIVASLVGDSGQATDLSTGNYRSMARPAILKNVRLAAESNYISPALPGLDVADNTDAGSENFSFTMNLPGMANASFGSVIAFGPDGQAYLPTAAGAMESAPVQCVGVGLNSGPASARTVHTAAVQVHGLSGQVSVFQQ